MSYDRATNLHWKFAHMSSPDGFQHADQFPDGVCVSVCRDVYMTVALWLSTAVKEDKSQLTSPTCSLPPALLHRGVLTQASLSHPVHLPC